MEISLWKAVKEGNCEKVRDLNRDNPETLKTVTPLGNTALHVAASRKDYKLAELLLSLKPCIILMRNVTQETALHKAAAAGCLEVVELLLNFRNEVRCNPSECAHPEGYDLERCRLDPEDLWRAPNVDHETALHYATRGDYVMTVSVLLKKVKGIALIVNKDGESALYTACQHGSLPMVKILGEIDCISDTRQDKETCLHQLINIDGPDHIDIALYLLRKRPALAEKADAADNVPLHLASLTGDLQIVEELLRIRPDMALRKNKDEMAPIHIAARMGHEATVSCLIDNVPDCIEVLGKDNKNALHFALEYGKISVAKTLLFKSMDPSFLINHADATGQTAFHKAAVDAKLAYEMLSPMLKISRWNLNAVDNNGQAMLDVVKAKTMTLKMRFTTTPFDRTHLHLRKYGAHRKAWKQMLLEYSTPLLEGTTKMVREDKNEVGEDKFEAGENLSVIATLIFTVTFAAALTVPGGVRSENGVPVRMHATALQFFTVCNTLAFCFSILAMFVLTKSRDKQEASIRRPSTRPFRVIYYRGYLAVKVGNCWFFPDGLSILHSAVGATILSFITGVYVMVAPKCLWLAITVCTMGVFTCFIYFFTYLANR